jgi:ribosomal protein S18 acetylase RimI-like enzyme
MSETIITVRKASPVDVNIIAMFQLQMAIETENITLDREVVIKGVKAVFENPTRGNYFIAMINQQVVGSMLTTPEWSDWRNRNILWIQSVYVIPEFRKMGVYKRLYTHLKDSIIGDPSIGGLRLYVDRNNHRAQTVYARLGMNGAHYQVFEWMK